MATPMRTTVLSALSIAWCWGVVAGSVGLNALIKSNQTQTQLKSKVPPPTVISINVNDIFTSGVVATTVSTLISVLTFNFILLHLLPFTRDTLGPRTLRLQSLSLAFCSVWLFATLVPFTQFFATRQPQVRAFVGSTELPKAIVEGVQKSLGASSAYKDFDYLKLVAILPWFTLLFTTIASVVTFMASSRVQRGDSPSHAPSSEDMTEKDRTEKDPV